ncbi:uncharacterized protein [Coffea arabica]|uniref:Uncharacterized protein isoform X1 n=1 Tax=Coffea arabica TaxID=13443 RepID=A0ABM4V429_COFAR|nr:transcription factor HBI1 isoform X1 [Coffea arabica]
MLHCMQTPSPENFTAAGMIADMSVLERQRAVLQRLYQQQQHQQDMHSSQPTTSSMPLFQYQNLVNPLKVHQENSPNFGFTCSEITTTNTNLEMDHHQLSCSNVTAASSKTHHVAPSKKRKAEFDVEEECKDKRVEGEAGEVQSGITVKSEKENSGRNSRENSSSKASEVVQKTDYIHVRARRGQATDSHSLAERARREKISKKMKCLQDLVPGCNKVTGKAGMLDEIINYVQSLQKQVEFLSMKLATLNPRLDFNVDNIFAKEFPAYIASFPTAATPIEVVHSALLQFNQGQQEPTSSGPDMAINPAQMVPQRTGTSSLTFPEAYFDSISSLSQTPTWDSDWQSFYNNVVSYH